MRIPRKALLVPIVVVAALLLGLVGGAVAYTRADKTVALSVDGEVRSVRGFARTVGEVLAAQDVRVGAHDTVAPAPETAVVDGMHIAVRYGRPLSLTVDGEDRKVWVTATDVAEALDQAGVATRGAFLSVSRSTPLGRAGLHLVLRTPHDVTVVADGRGRHLSSTAASVRGLLRDAHVALHPPTG